MEPVSPQICTRRHVPNRSPARTCRWIQWVPLSKTGRDRKEDEETRRGRSRRRGGCGGTQNLSKSERLSVSSIPTRDLDRRQNRSACLSSSFCLAFSFFHHVLPPPSSLRSNTNLLLHAPAPTLPAKHQRRERAGSR